MRSKTVAYVLLAALTAAGCNEEFFIAGIVDLSASPQGPFTSEQTVTLSAVVAENFAAMGLSHVEFYKAGTLEVLCSDSQAPFTCDWRITDADNGTHTWRARAYLEDGTSHRSPDLELVVDIDGNSATRNLSSGLIGHLPGVGTVTDVAVVGDRAFVSSQEFGLVVVDVSNASQPVVTARADRSFRGSVVDSNGSIAVVAGQDAEGYAHLWALDVTGDPTVVGELDSTLEAVNITAGFLDVALDPDGTRAVVAQSSRGIAVVDLSNPVTPTITDSVDTDGHAYGVTLQGDLVYVADGSASEALKLYRLTAADTLTLVSQAYSGLIIARKIVVRSGLAYVLNQNGGVYIVDVSQPASPHVISSMATSGFPQDIVIEGATLIALVGVVTNNGYGPTQYRLNTFGLTDPLRPSLIGSVLVSTDVPARSVHVRDGKVYVATLESGLKIYSIGSANPALLGEVTQEFRAIGASAGGTLAVIIGQNISQGTSELRVVDVSDPTSPTLLGALGTSDVVTSSTGFQRVTVHPSGAFAYVAHGLTGFSRLDLENPSHPTFTETHNDGGAAYGVTLAEDASRAYVAAGPAGVLAYSLSATGSATLIGQKPLTGVMRDAVALGDYLVVANQMGGLKFVDVSNPGAMVQVSGKSTSGFCFHTAAKGNTAVALNDDGSNLQLDVFDITDHRRPARVATVEVGPEGGARGVKMDDAGRVFIATGEGAVQVYDVSVPEAPAFLAAHETVGSVQGLALGNGLVYVADDTTGLSIVKP